MIHHSNIMLNTNRFLSHQTVDTVQNSIGTSIIRSWYCSLLILQSLAIQPGPPNFALSAPNSRIASPVHFSNICEAKFLSLSNCAWRFSYCLFLFADWTSDSHQTILFLSSCFDEKSSQGNRYILKWLKKQRNGSVEEEDFLVYLCLTASQGWLHCPHEAS